MIQRVRQISHHILSEMISFRGLRFPICRLVQAGEFPDPQHSGKMWSKLMGPIIPYIIDAKEDKVFILQ
jgi:hypothetical protein